MISDGPEVWHLQRARQLAPGDEEIWFRAGLLDFQAERLDSAWSSWRHALRLNPRHLDAVVVLARTKLDWTELNERVLPDSPELLLELAALQPIKRLADFPVEASQTLCRRAIELLSEESSVGHDHELLGRARVLLGELPMAAQHFSRAVELEPQNLSWRCRFVELLHEINRNDEARQQVQLCMQIAPNDERVQSLRRSLNQERIGP